MRTDSSLLLASCVGTGLLCALMGARTGRAWSPECYRTNNCDALTFAVVGELLSARTSPYSSETRIEHVRRTRLQGAAPPFDLPFQYPPYTLPLFALRPWPTPEAGVLLWVGLTTSSFLALLAILVQSRAVSVRESFPLLTVAATSGLLWFDGFLGQNGALGAALVSGVFLWWKPYPLVAGGLLGILAFKPHYALPLLVLASLRGERRILAASGVAILLLTGLSTVLYGANLWKDFWVVLGEPNPTQAYMVSWPGLALKVFPGIALAPSLTAVVSLGALAALVLVLRTFPNESESSPDLELGLCVSWALFFSPNTHPYDLLLLFPVLAALGTGGRDWSTALVVAAIAWLGLAPPHRWMLSSGMAACAGSCLYAVQRNARQAMDSGNTACPSNRRQ
jgi:hypothetical protein